MRSVVILALDDVIAFDLATAIETFRWVVLADGTPGYRITVAGSRRVVRSGPMSIMVEHDLSALGQADLVIVPGRSDPTVEVDPDVITALREAHAGGARLASICVGAFDLAATGLLDGRRATTHWRAAGLLAARHPLVTVDPAVLFVDDGTVLTSAGAAAGLDLCLHIIERDYGAAVAVGAARAAVMPLARDGGQAQFIDYATASTTDSSLAPVIAWMTEHLEEPLTLEAIACRAHERSHPVASIPSADRADADGGAGEYTAPTSPVTVGNHRQNDREDCRRDRAWQRSKPPRASRPSDWDWAHRLPPRLPHGQRGRRKLNAVHCLCPPLSPTPFVTE